MILLNDGNSYEGNNVYKLNMRTYPEEFDGSIFYINLNMKIIPDSLLEYMLWTEDNITIDMNLCQRITALEDMKHGEKTITKWSDTILLKRG